MEIDDREPIFWTSVRPGYNDADRQRPMMVDGKRVLEKFPQHGHVGDYDNKKRAGGQRFVYMIRHDGHEAAIVLTNAAAHLDPNTPYGQYVRMKARFLGWFGVADCPVAMLMICRMQPHHFVDKTLLDARPCNTQHTRAEPCPHAIAEKAARVAQNNRIAAEREVAYKDANGKLIEAGAAQTAAIIEGNLEATRELGKILASAIAQRDQPPPSEPTPRRGSRAAEISDDEPAAAAEPTKPAKPPKP